jgi:signal transduction histidine kinase
MRESESIVIIHEDTGPGIANPDKIFQPFQSGADSSGLGLFVSRAIVRAGGGDVAYEPGNSGCRMRIRLLAEPEEPPAPDEPDPQQESTEVHP